MIPPDAPLADAPPRSGMAGPFRPTAPAHSRSWLWPLLGVGLLVRLAAWVWNDRLFGDVNLYALVARQWSETGRLDYPGKFDFFDPTPYLALSSPVSQHPPAWSWLAGLIAALPVGLDEFAALKLLSLLAGLAVIVLGMGLARRLAPGQPHAATAVGVVLALHPMLVDFSANGSPYMGVAAGALAVAVAVVSTERAWWWRGLLAGVGAGAAWNFHGAGLLLAPAGLLALALNARSAAQHPPCSEMTESFRSSAYALLLLGAYLLGLGLLLAPLFAWNQTHFGHLLHSTSTYYLQGKLGLVALVEDAGGLHYQVRALDWTHLVPYLRLALTSAGQFLLHLGLETGVVGLGLAILAATTLYRREVRQRRALLGALGVLVAIVAPCVGWPEFKYRFLVPALPLVLILSTLGGIHLASGATRLRLTPVRALLGLTALACLGFWLVQIALTGSPAKYYAYDREHLRDYRLMREAAAFLKARPAGLVVALPEALDGGTEAAWWHHHPTVNVRGIGAGMLHRLITDFRPAYLLLSPERRADAPPGATLSFENQGYLVYELGTGS